MRNRSLQGSHPQASPRAQLLLQISSWLEAELVPNPGNSQPLIDEQDQSHLHFIVTQEFPDPAFLGRLKRVSLISPRPPLSGYWPERFPYTLVTGPKCSHQEGIAHFSLLEESPIQLLSEMSHGQGTENG